MLLLEKTEMHADITNVTFAGRRYSTIMKEVMQAGCFNLTERLEKLTSNDRRANIARH
jgi:hypothetical protein